MSVRHLSERNESTRSQTEDFKPSGRQTHYLDRLSHDCHIIECRHVADSITGAQPLKTDSSSAEFSSTRTQIGSASERDSIAVILESRRPIERCRSASSDLQIWTSVACDLTTVRDEGLNTAMSEMGVTTYTTEHYTHFSEMRFCYAGVGDGSTSHMSTAMVMCKGGHWWVIDGISLRHTLMRLLVHGLDNSGRSMSETVIEGSLGEREDSESYCGYGHTLHSRTKECVGRYEQIVVSIEDTVYRYGVVCWRLDYSGLIDGDTLLEDEARRVTYCGECSRWTRVVGVSLLGEQRQSILRVE
ncbi:hypothetical protein Tco_1346614 [Tanacetum coccineum]